ncbi:D-lactate dehydrogenase [Oleiagrimonas sp. C23AA]|uniref:D-lactate dehydrogenase n=1 Tax=Oleiagrimonas sp. C23AA TaxID=2719047 RepID=UPI0014218FA1|nr:D-lactate dehydrogenase [Oleiagrimonas sp. C23AA]NII12095.1 D-lactate dehydrogenase [Oleiagrimonas sp. C23AA]
MTGATDTLLEHCRQHLGRRHVLTGDSATRRFRQGFRYGSGPVLAVLRPGSLVQLWQVLQACVDADVVIIMQAANTGLTGGSTPDGDAYGRPVVIISTLRIGAIHLLDGGRQVLCLPGATLDRLEAKLAPLGREPHSVIGSSCLGASVVGGICNNSGGSLVRRGPAYTEMALYAQLGADGRLRLVNHLGMALGDDPLEQLSRIDRGQLPPVTAKGSACGSDHDYAEHVRQIDADTPARFNADPRRLREASGSAGRVAVMAVRLDTFAAEADTRVFYLGSNDTRAFTALRRQILGQFKHLPIACEYMHRDAFDMADHYGKDTFLAIRHLGTRRLPRFFALKSRFDSIGERLHLGAALSDRILQRLSRLAGDHLPHRLRQWRERYEHHLMLKVSAGEEADTRKALEALFSSHDGGWFACSADEGQAAFLHRFAAAGAAVRYRSVHRDEVEDILALDIALRRNDRDWFEQLPADIAAPISHRLYYGHFLCHVLHQDYIVRKGTDVHALEQRMLGILDTRGARYPAEHNVGHLYPAAESQQRFFRELDPCNRFNPGIGHTSRQPDWAPQNASQ